MTGQAASHSHARAQRMGSQLMHVSSYLLTVKQGSGSRKKKKKKKKKKKTGPLKKKKTEKKKRNK
eukprot:NODE_27430_length_514_cov_1.325581.p2 GENE.NODE_27430_length_514_cov_1.325581~~NODE_27430_length_514_cov_1.325581.p2  ORF type:complete len:65 (-),score=31.41 NODE_27430_length_514_cov_1.325581:53-247(-)